MSDKAAARAARQAKRDADFERGKARAIAQMGVAPSGGPRLQHLPPDEQMRLAIGIHPKQLQVPQQPRAVVDGGRLGLLVTWCVRKRDIDGQWSWGEARAWADDEWNQLIHPKFKEFERLTWGDVQKQASGEGHLMHHEQSITTLHDDAQARWIEIGLEEFGDALFRFRLGNKRRFWGFVAEGHFFGVWWERSHMLYQTDKD